MRFTFLFTILFATLLPVQTIWAWGNRGHHTVCEAAAYLVQEPALKAFLIHRTHIMGHLCNVPDIHWKSSAENRRIGDPTHYIDPEVIGKTARTMTLDLAKLEAEFEGKPNAFKADGEPIRILAQEMGTVWWRTQQLYQRSIQFGKQAKASALPTPKELQKSEHPYNQGVYDMMVNMGVMGHFVGDNGQPFHNTADYDGWKVGHGGIHGYYEEEAPAHLSANLVSEVTRTAQNLKKLNFMKGADVLSRMQELSVLSDADRSALLKIDPITKPSEEKVVEGARIRKPAERKPVATVAKKFEPFIIKHMAWSAWLLAKFWDEIYIEAGRPDLKPYQSYRYPFTPDFIAPDYIGKGKATSAQ